MPTSSSRPLVAIIPLKAIPRAKTRMAPELTADERVLLLHRMFGRIVQAVAGAVCVDDALVVVGDAQGASWARAHGLSTLAEPEGGGLNAALTAADDHLGDRPSLVLPADLPLVSGADLDVVAAAIPEGPAVVVAPTADGGTGALLRRPGGVIGPRFGPASAAAHLQLARQLGIPSQEVRVAGLRLDMDRPTDIDRAGGWSVVTGGRSLAR